LWAAKAVRTAFRGCLREIREEDREPEPEDDLEGETEILAAPAAFIPRPSDFQQHQRGLLFATQLLYR
jgi:hypothetical protein